MKGELDRGIVDQSAVGMRVATVSAGIWLTYVVCGTGAVYVALTWQRPHRGVMLAVFGMGLLGGLFVSRLPRERIVRSSYREVFFLSWSLLDLVLIAVGTCRRRRHAQSRRADLLHPGGVRGDVLPARLGRRRRRAERRGLPAAGAVTLGGAGWDTRRCSSVMLACTGAMSAWQARNHDRQRAALMEVSRADPLTGCLNRRGFEERAVAEISAATRRAGQGAVLVLDIDHFKPVNDRFGHAAGDELLRWVVRRIRATVRAERRGRPASAATSSRCCSPTSLQPTRWRARRRITAVLSDRAPCSVRAGDVPDGRRGARGADAPGGRAPVRLPPWSPRSGRDGARPRG